MAGEKATTATLEAQNTPEESSQSKDLNKLRPQIVASIVINLTSLSCGFCYSWGDLFLTSNKGALEVIAVPIGAILGAIVSGLLLDRIGRKWSLYATSTQFLAAPIIIYFVKKWPALFAARLVAGVSVGATFTTIPVYLGELTETRIRGAAIAMMPLLFNLGYLVMVGVRPLLNETILSIISLIPCVLFLLLAPWIPESPYYDLRRKKEKCAALSLAWLRRKRNNDQEISEMKEFIESKQQDGTATLFTTPVYRKALLIVLLLTAGQQLSGLIVLQPYADGLLKQMKLSINLLLIMSAVSFVTSIISASVVDIFGRKPLFLISSYGSSLCLLLTGAYYFLSKFGGMKLDHLSWIPLIAAVLHTVCFALGLAPIPQVLSSELFSVQTKSWANAVVVIFGSLLTIIVGETYRPVIDGQVFHIIFFALGAIELVIAILASIFMPETKRKSFTDIKNMLSGNAADEQSPAPTE